MIAKGGGRERDRGRPNQSNFASTFEHKFLSEETNCGSRMRRLGGANKCFTRQKLTCSSMQPGIAY